MAATRNGRRPDPAAFLRAIDRAIKIAGGQGALARKCGVTPPAIWKARQTFKISGELAKSIERATRRKVSAKRLRPDLWG